MVLLRIRSSSFCPMGSVLGDPPVDVAILVDDPGHVIVGAGISIGADGEDTGDAFFASKIKDGELGAKGIIEQILSQFGDDA